MIDITKLRQFDARAPGSARELARIRRIGVTNDYDQLLALLAEYGADLDQLAVVDIRPALDYILAPANENPTTGQTETTLP